MTVCSLGRIPNMTHSIALVLSSPHFLLHWASFLVLFPATSTKLLLDRRRHVGFTLSMWLIDLLKISLSLGRCFSADISVDKVTPLYTAPIITRIGHNAVDRASMFFCRQGMDIIIIIIYTTYIAPYIWPVWPFIGAEEGPSKY